jgi:hypothetical protein
LSRFQEHQFQAAAHEFLCHALPDALHWAVDHAGKRTKLQGARLKRRGVRAGIADHFTLHHGRLIAWEWKVGKNTTSDAQRVFGAEVQRCGGSYHVVWSLEEIESILCGYGWPLRASARGWKLQT